MIIMKKIYSNNQKLGIFYDKNHGALFHMIFPQEGIGTAIPPVTEYQ